MKTAIFLSSALYAQIRKNGQVLPYTEGSENPDPDIKYYFFKDYEDLKAMFSSMADGIDCAVTENLTAADEVYVISCEHDLPVCGIEVSNGTFYHSVLTQTLLKSIDLSRAGFDFLPAETNVRECIINDLLPYYRKQNSDRIEALLKEEPEKVENYILEKHRVQIENGEVDFLFTRNAKLAKFAEEKAVEYFFICPSEEEIEKAVNSAQALALEKERRKNLPSVITFRAETDTDEESEERNSLLKQAINDYGKKNRLYLPIKTSGDSFEVYTDAETLGLMTCHYIGCGITAFFEANLDFSVYVGYGIGNNIDQARVNSEEAISACVPNELIKLIDENGCEYMMKSCSDSCQSSVSAEESDRIKQAASKSGLSSAVITSIYLCLKKLGKDTISSSELMTQLGVSLRVANKYISKLYNAGLAEISGQKQNGGKGRPTKIYRIEL